MFSRTFITFQDEYEQCLKYYLADNNKQNAKNAREMGLKAVETKIELIDISRIHHDAIKKILEQQKEVKDCLLLINRSEQFLQEVLTPFEDKHSELEKVNMELGTFSRILTHDLCSPLRNITGFGKILKEESGALLNDRGKDFLTRIIFSAEKANKLIDCLFKLSTITKKELAINTVNLSDIAKELVNELKSKEPERDIEFCMTDEILVKGDHELLKEVMNNLLCNAFKFTSKVEHARIELGTTVKNRENIYFIKDNGAGFDKKYADKLFGAFQRLHTETEFAGCGLGLFAVQKIIQKHGGRTWAEGQENKGACFYFTIGV